VNILTLKETSRRLSADHALLLETVADLTGAQLAVRYQAGGNQLGESCESLHDLLAHVLMWDEINLAVLTEASAGRDHWSLDPRWEAASAGQSLNRGGVAAGRLLPAPMLTHRLLAVRDAVLDELSRHTEESWEGSGTGELAQRVWTVPGRDPFWHAAIHLGRMPVS